MNLSREIGGGFAQYWWYSQLSSITFNFSLTNKLKFFVEQIWIQSRVLNINRYTNGI